MWRRNQSLLPAAIYEQYLLSRLDNGKSPVWKRSASLDNGELGRFATKNGLYRRKFCGKDKHLFRNRQIYTLFF